MEQKHSLWSCDSNAQTLPFIRMLKLPDLHWLPTWGCGVVLLPSANGLYSSMPGFVVDWAACRTDGSCTKEKRRSSEIQTFSLLVAHCLLHLQCSTNHITAHYIAIIISMEMRCHQLNFLNFHWFEQWAYDNCRLLGVQNTKPGPSHVFSPANQDWMRYGSQQSASDTGTAIHSERCGRIATTPATASALIWLRRNITGGHFTNRYESGQSQTLY